MRRVLILGGGISGLSAAWFLTQRFSDQIQVTVLEASDHFGGWMRTQNEEGFFCERGPRAFRKSGTGQLALYLIEQLGLLPEVIESSPEAHRRFLVRQGKLEPLPQGIRGWLRSPLLWPVLKGIIKEPFVAVGKTEDESILSFITRRVGAQLAWELVDPLVLVIYGGQIEKLSMRSCFPSLWEAEKKFGSLTRFALAKKDPHPYPELQEAKALGTKGLFSLKGGVGSLIARLVQAIPGDLRLNAPVARVELQESGAVVTLDSGEQIQADTVISSLSASVLASTLCAPDPVIEALKQMPALTLTVVHLGYVGRRLSQEGFGVSIPSQEKSSVLGIVFDSSAFPEQNQDGEQTRLTCMLRGVLTPEAALREAKEVVSKLLHIHQAPQFQQVNCCQGAIPQYLVGHHERAQIAHAFAKEQKHLHLIGSHFGGVGVGDCLAASWRLAQTFS